MSARRPAWAPAFVLVILLALLAPAAGAFSTREAPLDLAYERSDTPLVFATGALRIDGTLRAGFLATEVVGATFRDVPSVEVVERVPGAPVPRATTFRNVDVMIHDGSLLWRFDNGSRLDLTLAPDYGMGLALPRLPLVQPTGEGPGLLVVAPSLASTLSWSGTGQVLPLDAEVTLLDANGDPFPGWERREVNPGARSDASDLSTVLRVSGAFEGTVDARVQGGAFGASPGFTLTVSPAEEDRFPATLDALAQAAEVLGPDADEALGSESPLRQLEPLSGLLNGALLVFSEAPGEGAGAARPTRATLGDEPFEPGPLALLRGDPMQVAWSESQMIVQGTPAVVVSSQGFAVEEPATLGPVPLVSVLLWALALAAIVSWFLLRPPKADAQLTLRLVSWLVYVVVLLGALAWWDASFADTFGTSVGTLLLDGSAFDDVPRLMFLLAVEGAPWGLAALLFALPVRIVLGVALRHLGKGKSFTRMAKAGGLVALAILGPLYALWLVNVVIGRALELLPNPFG